MIPSKRRWNVEPFLRRTRKQVKDKRLQPAQPQRGFGELKLEKGKDSFM
jgi:hypothetical protein